jgi:hypothetical protein
VSIRVVPSDQEQGASSNSSASRNDEGHGCSDRRFEVTVLTTRSGSTSTIIAASDHAEAHNIVASELASGQLTAPPEQCTDDVQTEIWTVCEISG